MAEGIPQPLPGEAGVPEDPHGMVALFASRLNSNLPLMAPRAATEDALVAVKRHLDGSDFIDLSSKSGREYVRVDKRERAERRGSKTLMKSNNRKGKR